jgi:hypothetical protein
MGDELWQRTGVEMASMIATGEVSSREVVDAHLDHPIYAGRREVGPVDGVVGGGRTEAVAGHARTVDHLRPPASGWLDPRW